VEGFLFLFFEDKDGRMMNEDQGGMRDGFGFFFQIFFQIDEWMKKGYRRKGSEIF
jgi:hypothetical protein